MEEYIEKLWIFVSQHGGKMNLSEVAKSGIRRPKLIDSNGETIKFRRMMEKYGNTRFIIKEVGERPHIECFAHVIGDYRKNNDTIPSLSSDRKKQTLILPVDEAISTALSARRYSLSLSPLSAAAAAAATPSPVDNRKESGMTNKRHREQKEEAWEDHSDRQDSNDGHSCDNRKKSRITKQGNNGNTRHQQILQEQQKFRYCEDQFLPLIRRWEKAIEGQDFKKLTKIYKQLLLPPFGHDDDDGDGGDGNDNNKLRLFTAPFCEVYNIKELLRDSKHFVSDANLKKLVIDTFASMYGMSKRITPIGFKPRKGVDYSDDATDDNNRSDDRNHNSRYTSKGRNEEYTDIRIERNGDVTQSDQKEFRDILFRVISLGYPVSYRDRFRGAKKDSDKQCLIAGYVSGAMRNTERVRFLQRKNKSNQWIEAGRQNCIRLIASALLDELVEPELVEQNVRSPENDMIAVGNDDNVQRNLLHSRTIGESRSDKDDEDNSHRNYHHSRTAEQRKNNDKYTDIRINSSGRVTQLDHDLFRDIFLCTISSGSPNSSYRDRFCKAKIEDKVGLQYAIATNVFGAMRNTESVRFLQRDDTLNEWIEAEDQKVIRLIVSAFSEELVPEQNIRSFTDNNMKEDEDDIHSNRHHDRIIGGQKNNYDCDDDKGTQSSNRHHSRSVEVWKNNDNFIDIRINRSGQIEQSDEGSFRDIFLRTISLGGRVSYKDRFRQAKNNKGLQYEIATNVLGVMHDTESVRFLHRHDTSSMWIETEDQQVIRLIVTTLSVELSQNEITIIRPRERSDILMGRNCNGFQNSQKEKLEQILNIVLQVGKPTYRQKFRKESNVQRWVQIIIGGVLVYIRENTHPPMRFLTRNPKSDRYQIVDDQKVAIALCATIQSVIWRTQPTDNDVLVYDAHGEYRDRYKGNIKFRELVEKEGYLESYRNAYLIQNFKDKTEQTLHVVQQVLDRLQQSSPSIRFLLPTKEQNAWVESVNRRRMLNINHFLWKLTFGWNVDVGATVKGLVDDNGDILTSEDDCLMTHGIERLFIPESIEKLRILSCKTGKFDYFVERLRRANTQPETKDVVDELLFTIKVINPCLRFLYRVKETAKWKRVPDKKIVAQILKILTNNSKATDCHQRDAVVLQDETILPLTVRNHTLTYDERLIESGEGRDVNDDNDDDDGDEGDEDEYFVLNDTIFIDIEPQQIVSEQQQGSIVRERIVPTNEASATTKAVNREPEEERHRHSASLVDWSSSNFSTNDETPTATHQNKCSIYHNTKIKQVKKEEPTKDQIKIEETEECGDNRPDHEANKNAEKSEGHIIAESNIKQEDENIDDENPEIIEIDPSDDGSNLESRAKYLPNNDRPPQIKSIDVNMSDVSLGGDFESSISKTEASATTGRTATAIRIIRGKSLEATLPLSTILQCLNGNDVLRSAANQAVLDRVPLFIFGDDIKKAIRDETKVVRYEFRGQNPTSAQFKLLPIDDILRGDTLTVQITMSIHDVERKGGVTIEESLF